MEDFVSFELAKKLKEKGFPQRPNLFDYSSYYEWDGLRKIHSQYNASIWFDPNVSRDSIYFAPTISQVLKWLREENGISLNVYPSYFANLLYWTCDVLSFIDEIRIEERLQGDVKTYEEAAVYGIEYVLDNLI